MQYIKTKTPWGHVTGEGCFLAHPPLSGPQHRQTGEPGIGIGQKFLQIVQGCIVFAPEPDSIMDCQQAAEPQQRRCVFCQQLLDPVMGENAVAAEIHEYVDSVAVHFNDRRVQDLSAAPHGKYHQAEDRHILTNEVYLGKIRWRREPVKRVVRDGFLAKTRILNDDYELYDGMHEPIITEEQWELAQAVKKKKGHHSTHTTKELKNPFAGILFCEKCGAGLKRNVPGKNQGTAPWFRCPTRGCDCRIVKCHTVEEAIRDAMEDWLDEYIIQLNSESKPKVDPIATALEAVQAQLAGLQQQQDTLCDYLEKGVYTIDMFTKRNATLSREIKKLQESEAELMRKKESGSQANQAAREIIPTTQHILDNYDVLTIAEKNRLWKLVMKKATVYRTPDGELSVHIYPKLPK